MKSFESVILIGPQYWRSSCFSIARFYGRISIEGTLYGIDSASDYLVRADFLRVSNALGVKVVEKALKRYADADKAKKVLSRLAHIIKARKSPQNDPQLSLEL